MPTEAHERSATADALNQISDWLKPGTNEGVSFEMSRLSDDLFTDSFLAGGDISLFTPVGARGIIKSQLSKAHRLDSGGGVPAQFDIDLTIDLNIGAATGKWAYPGETAKTYHFKLELLKRRPSASQLLFYGEAASSDDDAGYTLSFTLL
jgi:hypothetical protein